MSDIDRLLSMVENPTRRRILQALVREPHYPLQLSKELKISQQAIMKHLRVLEECGLVSSYTEDSDRGPARKQYVPASEFTLVVDLRPGLFSTRVLEHRQVEEERPVEKVGDLEQLRMELREIDDMLEELAEKRAGLLDRRARLLYRARRLSLEHEDYQLRRVMYEVLNHPALGLDQIAKDLSMREDRLREMIREMSR